MTGMAASGPMSPNPSTAVPSLTTATMFFLMVKRRNMVFAALSVLAYACIIFGSNIEVLLL